MTDDRIHLNLPVLMGKRISGRAPWLASWLRGIAECIEALADRIDDRYESPVMYDEVPFRATWTFGDASREEDE